MTTAVTASMLTGCGGGASTATDSSASGTGSTETGSESADGDITDFTMFIAMPGSEINDGNEIQELIAQKTGVRVKETWLTGQTAEEAIGTIIDNKYCYFYDAAAPIVSFDSVDMNIAYKKSRYDKGSADYINCPMDVDQFNAFYDALITAEVAEVHGFENEKVFEGCMPFEVMAKRGRNTLLFGPMKPVGLETPDGKRPYAIVQLRQDNVEASLYNIVGFQTHLKWPEQKRIIRMIPGLENAEIVRYGVMHRNTYINSPVALEESYAFKGRNDLFFAGQMTGVEGYVESSASGMLAGINLAHVLNGEEVCLPGNQTVIGSMSYYITHADPRNFQPMNANFGIVHLDAAVKKKDRKNAYAPQSLEIIRKLKEDGRL